MLLTFDVIFVLLASCNSTRSSSELFDAPYKQLAEEKGDDALFDCLIGYWTDVERWAYAWLNCDIGSLIDSLDNRQSDEMPF